MRSYDDVKSDDRYTEDCLSPAEREHSDAEKSLAIEDDARDACDCEMDLKEGQWSRIYCRSCIEREEEL